MNRTHPSQAAPRPPAAPDAPQTPSRSRSTPSTGRLDAGNDPTPGLVRPPAPHPPLRQVVPAPVAAYREVAGDRSTALRVASTGDRVTPTAAAGPPRPTMWPTPLSIAAVASYVREKRMGKSLWTTIAEIAARGGRPIVAFPRACEVIEPRRAVGRPRIHPVGAKRGHEYALTTPSGRPMRCRRRGCQRTLRKDAQSICCSAQCEWLLKSECLDVLDVLDGRVEARHLPPYWRAHNKRWFRHDEADRRAGLLPNRQRDPRT